MASYACPHCSNPVSVPDHMAGQVVSCTHCNGQMTVPSEAHPAGAPPPEQQLQQPSIALAVVSLVLGILSFVFCFGPLSAIPGIITGHMARSKVKREPATTGGSGMALAGLILSYINIVVVVVLLVPAIILLPALTRAREAAREKVKGMATSRIPALARAGEAARRAACQDNLKQMGIVFKMFANENKDYWPQLSSESGRLAFANEGTDYTDSVHPNLLTDLRILVCPSDTDNYLLDAPNASTDANLLINDHSYFYLGYVVTNEEEMAAYADAYRQSISEGLGFDEDLEVPAGTGNAGGDKIYRLREGVERILITDIFNPPSGSFGQAETPVLIERVDNHVPGGGNVLFMDGHVEFMHYPGQWPMTEETIGILESLDDL